MAVRIQVRRDTFDNWATANPVLASGEIGYITDRRMAKVGNGTAAFRDLEFLVGGSEAEMIALINRNTASITEEAQTRASADATLQSAISTESAARSEGDNVLNGRVQALENAEPDVPAGLVEQVDANTESIIGLVKNDENLTEALNGKLGLPQGELTELNQNDWLIIGRTDPNTGTTPTYLSRLSQLKDEIGGGDDTALTARVDDLEDDVETLQKQFAGGSDFLSTLDGRVTANAEAISGLDDRLEKLEEGTEPPVDEGFGVYNFAGETWWGQPDAGELWMNFGENQFFMSATDANGKNLKSFYEGMVKGQSIAVQGPNGFGRFLLKSAPSFGSSMNGDYFTIAVREEYVQGGMEIGDRLLLILEENTRENYGFEAVVAVDPIVELTEIVGKMRKEITSLKTSLTKIRKSVNGSD